MLTSKVTGNKIIAFLGVRSFDKDATISIVKTEAPDPKAVCDTKTVYEIYARNGFGLEIEDDPNNYICDYEPKTNNDYVEVMKATKYFLDTYRFWSGEKLTENTVNTIKNFYNDYYKYEKEFQEVR